MQAERKFIDYLDDLKSTNAAVSEQSAQCLSQFMQFNPKEFLNQLYLILSEQSAPVPYRCVALILAYRTLNWFQTINPIHFQIDETLNNLLLNLCKQSVYLFTSFGIHATSLFAKICEIYLDAQNDSSIIEALCNNLQNATDISFIENSLNAIYQITEKEDLYKNQYDPILNIIFLYLSNKSISLTIKEQCLNIISEMIQSMTELFSDSNSYAKVSLLKLICGSLEIPELKLSAYKCLTQIAGFFYDQFPNDIYIIKILIHDLTHTNENICDEILTLINAIAYSEDLFNINDGIIHKYFEPIFQCLNMLLIKYFDEIDDNKPESTCASIEVLRNLAKQFPMLTFNRYFQKANELIHENQDQHFIALALYLLMFIIENYEINEQNNFDFEFIFKIIDSIFSCTSIQTYLLNVAILILGEIAQKSEVLNIKVSKYVPIIVSSIQISLTTAFHAFYTLDQINYYQHINQYFVFLLNYFHFTYPTFSFALANIIKRMILKTINNDEIPMLVKCFHEFFIQSFNHPELIHNQEDIFTVYSIFCIKCQKLMLQDLIIQNLEADLQLFINHFLIHHDSMILKVLTTIIITYKLTNYLDVLMKIIFSVLEHSLNITDIKYVSNSLVALMMNCSPISIYLQQLKTHISNIKENDLNIYKKLIKIVKCSITYYYSNDNINIINEFVSEMIQIIINLIDNFDNFAYISDKMKFALKTLTLIIKVFQNIVDINVKRLCVDMSYHLIFRISQFDEITKYYKDDDDLLEVQDFYEPIVCVFYCLIKFDKNQFAEVLNQNKDLQRFIGNMIKGTQENAKLICILRQIGLSEENLKQLLC